jgi:hypothetical protein
VKGILVSILKQDFGSLGPFQVIDENLGQEKRLANIYKTYVSIPFAEKLSLNKEKLEPDELKML